MDNKIKVSFSRNFGTENIAITAEVLPSEFPQLQKFFRDSVISQYEDVLNTAIPESEITKKGADERAKALKEKTDAIEALNKEAKRNLDATENAQKLLKRKDRLEK